MDAFRISLIVVGVTVLLVIYLFDSNKKIRSFIKSLKKLQLKQFFSNKHYSDNNYSHEPKINDDSEILEHIEQMDGVVANHDSNVLYSSDELDSKEQEILELTDEVSVSPIDEAGEEMVIVLFIISRGTQYFSGAEINNVCTSNGFEFSDRNTFEKFSDTNFKDKRPVASIVNSFEPGTFDSDFDNFETKAITILLFLPGPDAEMKAFDDILVRAKNIAQHLHGELCDETRSVLTQQTISHIQEKIEAFQFKNKMLKTSQQR